MFSDIKTVNQATYSFLSTSKAIWLTKSANKNDNINPPIPEKSKNQTIITKGIRSIQNSKNDARNPLLVLKNIYFLSIKVVITKIKVFIRIFSIL